MASYWGRLVVCCCANANAPNNDTYFHPLDRFVVAILDDRRAWPVGPCCWVGCASCCSSRQHAVFDAGPAGCGHGAGVVCLDDAAEWTSNAAGGDLEDYAGRSGEAADRTLEDRQRFEKTVAVQRGFDPTQSAGRAAGDHFSAARGAGGCTGYFQAVSQPRCFI